MKKQAALDLDTIERLYHRKYYLEDCDGYREYLRSNGQRLPRRLRKCVELLDPKEGDRVLDVGSGRGELAAHVARLGARVWAVDPASAAARLLRGQIESCATEPTSLDREGSRTPMAAVRARGEQLPFPDHSTDGVMLADVVEHLPPAALEGMLAECHRVLRPGGRLVIHTEPNRILLDWTVPILSRFARLWGQEVPRDLRVEGTRGVGREYHVNEQSRSRLARSVTKAGFRVDECWLEGTYPIHRLFGEWRLKPLILSNFRRRAWLRQLFADSIFCVAVRNPDRTATHLRARG